MLFHQMATRSIEWIKQLAAADVSIFGPIVMGLFTHLFGQRLVFNYSKSFCWFPVDFEKRPAAKPTVLFNIPSQFI